MKRKNQPHRIRARLKTALRNRQKHVDKWKEALRTMPNAVGLQRKYNKALMEVEAIENRLERVSG